MIRDLGYIEPGQTLYLPFHSFDSNDPIASTTISGLLTSDIEIYKDGSTTQRSSDNGYALLDSDGIDFDGITGINGISIDLADNSVAGFYAAGSQYWIVIASITVDTGTINFIHATFRIGYEQAMLNTTIASLSSQTSFTLTDGPAENDALNGMWAVVHDVASKVQKAVVQITDYVGGTKTVTLAAGATFTIAATDNISVMGPMPVQPTDIIDNGLTLKNALRLFMAALGGETSGAGTSTIIFKAADGSQTRITATMDEDNNRTEVVLNFAD
jgi:hypothetical protein